jgi:hypothetical protein
MAADAGGAAKRTKLSAVDPYPGNIDRNRMALKASNKLREYLDMMSPQDLERYEHFRRSSFKHDTVKQLMLRTIKTTCVRVSENHGRVPSTRRGCCVAGFACTHSDLSARARLNARVGRRSQWRRAR